VGRRGERLHADEPSASCTCGESLSMQSACNQRAPLRVLQDVDNLHNLLLRLSQARYVLKARRDLRGNQTLSGTSSGTSSGTQVHSKALRCTQHGTSQHGTSQRGTSQHGTSQQKKRTLVAFTAFDLPTLKRPPPGPPPIDAPMPRERIRKKPMINNVGAKRPTSDMIEGCTMNCTGR